MTAAEISDDETVQLLRDTARLFEQQLNLAAARGIVARVTVRPIHAIGLPNHCRLDVDIWKKM